MTKPHHRWLVPLVLLGLLGGGAAACGDDGRSDALVRLDQAGYATRETKVAMLLAPRDASGARVEVIDAHGDTVLRPTVGAGRGVWNDAFPDVRPIDVSALTKQGSYRIRVRGTVRAESGPFRVSAAPDLFDPLVTGSLRYFQAHRDGADQVSGEWQRRPAHLTDRSATVYQRPDFDEAGRLSADLVEAGGPVDVEGGWYDAGDFLKFTHTTAYAVALMMLAQRDGLARDAVAAESRHGVDWLDKMWDGETGTLHTQVGIGSGRGFLGDHDSWRLPEDDDRLDVRPGDQRYFQRHRPVFRAAEPGEPISPNLAGRVAAAFALAAQVESRDDPGRGKAHLDAAAQVFDLADTDRDDELVTAEPHTFYPESSWTDDLALGAAELALAGRLLGDARAPGWARQAADWTERTVAARSTGVLSVYDVGALADAELVRLLRTGPITGSAMTADVPLEDLRRRLEAGTTAAATNPMGAAAGNGGSDYAARQLGHAAMAELYEHASGDHRYAAFATAQRGVVLGANGWGASFVVGAGTTFPRCPHDQIATLTRTGAAGLSMIGAVVNGPNRPDRVHDLLARPGPVRCGTDAFAAFDRDDAHYADDMRVSANTEASIDFSATGLLTFGLMSVQH